MIMKHASQGLFCVVTIHTMTLCVCRKYAMFSFSSCTHTYLCLWSTRLSPSNSINSRHTCRERRADDIQRLDRVAMETGASRASGASRDCHGVHHTHSYEVACHILINTRQKVRRILDKSMVGSLEWGVWSTMWASYIHDIVHVDQFNHAICYWRSP